MLRFWSIVCLLFVLTSIAWLGLFWSKDIPPLPESMVDSTFEIDHVTYKLIDDGRLFRVAERSGKWSYLDTVFFPSEMLSAYRSENGRVCRLSQDESLSYPVQRTFCETFEDLPLGVAGLRRLMNPDRGWGSLTLQSPETPGVNDYVKLRQRILSNQAQFGDASVEPDSQYAYRGRNSLKCVAPPRLKSMICCKSSISSPLVYFRQGDDFWFRAHYFSEETRPYSLMDLECEWIKLHGGIRLFIDEQGILGVELKALEKPKYRQRPELAIEFPLNRWVEVQAHFRLSDRQDGIVQVWQDGQLIIDTNGKTLPLSRAIYSSLEVGISAHSSTDKSAILWVDDISVSDTPFD